MRFGKLTSLLGLIISALSGFNAKAQQKDLERVNELIQLGQLHGTIKVEREIDPRSLDDDTVKIIEKSIQYHRDLKSPVLLFPANGPARLNYDEYKKIIERAMQTITSADGN